MAKIKGFLVCLFLCFSSLCFAQQGDFVRNGVRNTYVAHIGVREQSGKNDGVMVEKFLSYVWLKKGQPWCAAFVSWVFSQNKIKSARAGGCVSLMAQGKIVYKVGSNTNGLPRYSDVFFIWFANKGRVAHTGFIDKWDETWVTTVEGNTNEAGSREGDGVYRKRRLKRQIYAVTSYIKD